MRRCLPSPSRALRQSLVVPVPHPAGAAARKACTWVHGGPTWRCWAMNMEPQQKRLKTTQSSDSRMATQSTNNLEPSGSIGAVEPTPDCSRPMSTQAGGRGTAPAGPGMPSLAAALAVRAVTRKNEAITLLPAEDLLRSLLLDCRAHMVRSEVAAAAGLEIWFTGGWVRDRLLDIPCCDIDIALRTMTGQTFGDALADFFHQNRGRYERRARDLGLDSATMSGLHTTKQNLRKSKQLETTIGNVFGLDIDIVNLRKEVYDADSRTPEMEFGTAQEDAFRRDATVNALFYHLDSQQVVDLTGRGLHDMAAGIIRTPLEPRQTFMDDPLRVLRLIRIGSKLGYTIDDETKTCIKDDEIHRALTAKVSRERVGIELFKIMKRSNPQLAFHLIFEANLYDAVFLQLDPSIRQPDPSVRKILEAHLPIQDTGQQWPATWPHAYLTLASLINNKSTRLGSLVQSEDMAENLWVMAAYAPLAALRHDHLRDAVQTAAEAIKATVKTSKILERALRNTDAIRSIVARTNNHHETPLPRSAVGVAIRAWGDTWKLQLMYSLLAEIVYGSMPEQPPCSAASEAAVAKLLQQYTGFLEFVMQHDLDKAYDARPLLNGNAIMALFGVSKGGSYVKTAIDALVAWQFDNEGAGVDQAKEWLRLQQDSLGLPSRGVSSQSAPTQPHRAASPSEGA